MSEHLLIGNRGRCGIFTKNLDHPEKIDFNIHCVDETTMEETESLFSCDVYQDYIALRTFQEIEICRLSLKSPLRPFQDPLTLDSNLVAIPSRCNGADATLSILFREKSFFITEGYRITVLTYKSDHGGRRLCRNCYKTDNAVFRKVSHVNNCDSLGRIKIKKY